MVLLSADVYLDLLEKGKIPFNIKANPNPQWLLPTERDDLDYPEFVGKIIPTIKGGCDAILQQ